MLFQSYKIYIKNFNINFFFVKSLVKDEKRCPNISTLIPTQQEKLLALNRKRKNIYDIWGDIDV
jgi:hypothetical protein